jgi:hypothetical protein
MSNETKTAVQILVDSLIKLGYLHSNEFGQSPKVRELINQVQEMERQRMIEFARLYVKSDSIYCGGEFDIEKDAEHFYNETYGGNK